MNKLLIILIIMFFTGGLFAFGTDKSKPIKSNQSQTNFEKFNHIRAARILQGVRFSGNSPYIDVDGKTTGDYTKNYIEFNNEGNFIYLKINAAYRQGKITILGKSDLNSTQGVYSIITWIPQAYSGFNKGPSRKYFKKFTLKWKVKKVKTTEFTGRVLYLTITHIRHMGVKKVTTLKYALKAEKRN